MRLVKAKKLLQAILFADRRMIIACVLVFAICGGCVLVDDRPVGEVAPTSIAARQGSTQTSEPPHSTDPVETTPQFTGDTRTAMLPLVETVLTCDQSNGLSFDGLISSDADYLVLRRSSDDTDSVWTLSTGEQQYSRIPLSEDARFPYVSPNMTDLAFLQSNGDKTRLVLSSLNGNRNSVLLEANRDQYYQARWYGEGALALFRFVDYTNRASILWPTKSILVETGAMSDFQIPSEETPIEYIFLGPGNGQGIVMLNDPSTSWGFYGLHKGMLLETFPAPSGATAVWSQDGDHVAVTGEDIVIVDASSMETLIELDMSPGEASTYYRDPLGWDPSSTQLAFALSSPRSRCEGHSTGGIFIFDMDEWLIRHYCLDFRDASGGNFFWSPSGRFVAWSNRDPIETVILDVAEPSLLSIQGANIIGWGRETARH